MSDERDERERLADWLENEAEIRERGVTLAESRRHWKGADAKEYRRAAALIRDK